MEYSAAGVKFLLWFVETRETIRLLQNHEMDEVKKIVVDQNIYQQKTQSRIISEFGYIKKRVLSIPKDLSNYMIRTDVNTAKLIALISAMATDRLLFELVYEVYRNKLRMGEGDFSDADLNIFFTDKIKQSDVIAAWTEATIKKLKQTYTKFLMEAGLLQKTNQSEKKVVKPYIEQELREILIRNNMDKYLYALTGER
jgi:hypothetical protein